jgi:anaerobic selenocysteine-containing dehydrogenase
VTMTDYSICSASGHAGIGLHYGLSYGRNPMDMSRNRNIVFWGFNAKTSSPHQWALATLARKVNGSRIIVVDPRESETAEIADLWISPRPGSDVALAYGLARYLIINKIVDMDFIERYTHGYETYKEEALCWTPDRVQAISGVRWSEIEVLGDLLRESPSVFMIGLGLNKSLTGAESCRAVSLLPTLLGEHRGFYYTNSRGTYIQGDPYGSTLTERKPRVVSMVSLGERLASGQFKFVYVVGMNPVLTLPDANNVAAGFKREDCFLVVHDTHFTETTKLADVILPATTYLEKNDVYVSDCHPFIRLGTKAIEPIAESMDEHRLMTELAQRLKLDEPWVTADPWLDMEKNFHEAFCEGEFSDLLEGKYLKIRYRSLDEYQTQTGKIEFTTTSAPFGVSQLPKQIELDIREGEFIMLNSSLPQYTHTQFRDVYGKIINMIWMNPVDAERLSIEDSENHVMYNERGKIRVKIKVTIKVQEGVVWAPRELVDDEGNIQNSLTRGVAQVIGGGPIFNSVKVRFQS